MTGGGMDQAAYPLRARAVPRIDRSKTANAWGRVMPSCKEQSAGKRFRIFRVACCCTATRRTDAPSQIQLCCPSSAASPFCAPLPESTPTAAPWLTIVDRATIGSDQHAHATWRTPAFAVGDMRDTAARRSRSSIPILQSFSVLACARLGQLECANTLKGIETLPSVCVDEASLTPRFLPKC